jgi:hypothetical protein
MVFNPNSPGYNPLQDTLNFEDQNGWFLDEDGFLKQTVSAKKLNKNPDYYTYAEKKTYLLEDKYQQNGDQYTGSYVSSANRVIQYYKSTGQLDLLKAKLAKAYGVSIVSIGEADARAYLNDAIKNVTSANWTAQYNAPKAGLGKQLTIIEWLNSKIAGGTGGAGGAAAITSEVSYTQKKTAWDKFKSISQDLLNAAPSRDDFEDFYKKLHKEEGKYIDSFKEVGSRRYSTNADFNVDEFTLKYFVKKIDLQSPDLKGAAGQAQDSINQLIRDNGLQTFITNKTKIQFLKGILTQDKTVDDFKDVLRKQAMNVYSQWGKEMQDNPDLSFSDIIAPYASRYQQTLEIDGPVDVTDVAKLAVNGDQKLSAFEYEKALRDDRRWGYTKQANGEAAQLAKSFAKAFGVGV